MNMRNYERLSFDEWILHYFTVHPQLYLFEDEKNLLNLQEVLSEKYRENIYTKEDVTNIYNNYLEKKREDNIKMWDIRTFYENKVKLLINNEKDKTNKYIQDLIKEI
jgi:hypothetical protein